MVWEKLAAITFPNESEIVFNLTSGGGVVGGDTAPVPFRQNLSVTTIPLREFCSHLIS